MEWLNPIAHFAWPFVIGAGVLGIMARRWMRRDRRRFASAKMVDRLADRTDERRRTRSVLVLTALVLLTISLAGPRIGSTPREVSRSGLDLVIALDVSDSMLAQDVAPSRLERARHELRQMTEQLQGDRVALVTFAGDAFVQMPLTRDRSAFRMFLDVASSDQIPTPGTDFLAMLTVVQQAFARSDDADDRSRVVLVVSDGENHVDGISSVVRDMRANGLEVFTLGIGGREGARIPTRSATGQVSYRHDRQGETVRTRLEDEVLREMSGPDRFYEIGRSINTFTEFPAALDRLQRTDIDSMMFEDYNEWFQWPLLLALVLLVGERSLMLRRREPDANVVETE